MDNKKIKHSKVDIDSVVRHFTAIGGEFVTPIRELAAKINNIKAMIFDWDGVFNDGTKGEQYSSSFSEADSMGTNMLRYGLWLNTDNMPVTAVISGENNRSARQFAQREHFDSVYLGIKDKRIAVNHFCATHDIRPESVACIFDDINDLSMAKICSVRSLVRRSASPLFTEYVRNNRLCDYISGNVSGRHVVREVSELLLGLIGLFETVVTSRVAIDGQYRHYFNQRQSLSTHMYKQEGDAVVAASEKT